MTEQIPPPEDESRRSLIGIVMVFQIVVLWSFAAITIVVKFA